MGSGEIESGFFLSPGGPKNNGRNREYKAFFKKIFLLSAGRGPKGVRGSGVGGGGLGGPPRGRPTNKIKKSISNIQQNVRRPQKMLQKWTER